MSKNERNFTNKNITHIIKIRKEVIIMKTFIKKSITVITVLAIALTLAMPMNAEAASKKSPKLNKSKITLTITKKKTKPAYKLKVKNYSKRVKWTSTNKKVATVSKTGKVVAKKKGTAIVRVKVGKRVLKCKVVVKDTRKANKNKKPGTTTKPISEPTPNPTPEPTECQHEWVAVTKTVICCNGCNEIFNTNDEFYAHAWDYEVTGDNSHNSCGICEIIDHYKCAKCPATKNAD